jgi:predicted amidophosphoribosyltransferase
MKNVLYVREYHEFDVREITHRLKAGDKNALRLAALEMEPLVPRNCVLVPVPGHLGYPKATKDLAELLTTLTGCPTRDIIRGNERPSWCFLKKKGLILTDEDFGFQIMEGVSKPILLIDNVYATGTTYRAIRRVLPGAKILVFSIDKTQNNEP